MPGQKIRKKSVRQKLNAIDLEFRGKNVLLVDDSIVRAPPRTDYLHGSGRLAPARCISLRRAPPVRYPNVYGIDMPAAHELIAHGRSEKEVARHRRRSSDFQDPSDLEEAVRRGNRALKTFDASCFTGEYVTGDIDQAYLDCLARRAFRQRQGHP